MRRWAVSPAGGCGPRGPPGRPGRGGPGGGRICSCCVPSIRRLRTGLRGLALRRGAARGARPVLAWSAWTVSSRSISRRIHAERVSSPRAPSRRPRVASGTRSCTKGRSRGSPVVTGCRTAGRCRKASRFPGAPGERGLELSQAIPREAAALVIERERGAPGRNTGGLRRALAEDAAGDLERGHLGIPGSAVPPWPAA